MDTEYRGHPIFAWLHELRQRGWRNSAWRAGYELRKRFGLVESSFRAEPLAAEELCGLFDPRPSDPGELRQRLAGHLSRTFLIPPGEREAYVQAVRRHCPGRIDGLVAAADRICEGRFELMGRVFDFQGGPIDWHLDPDSGRSWPRLRWNRFTVYDADAPGDVKFTWELNRHQFWPTLARAWWVTGDDRYVEAWISQITSWLDDNPPEIGVNWRSNLEHAIRIVNWWIALAMFLPARQLSDDLVCRIVGTMILAARHIVADLDYSRINMSNNHLLGDAMGLAVMGMVLPDLREGRQWRDLGLETLWAEAPRQIHPDGASFECAISYHRFVAYFYVVIVRLCRGNGLAVPDVVLERLERMFEFVLHLRRPDGGMPNIGDWDDGRTVVLSEQAVDDFRPMLSTGAVLFNRADMAWAAEGLDEETLWLLGPEAGEAFDALDLSPPSRTSEAFPQGGYFISRSDWTSGAHYAVVRNGPFDSHTHADLLNVELAAFGRPIVIDPGTYTYNGPWAWRTHFRSGPAHNVPTVDGQGQACAHRIFRWLFPPAGKTRSWDVGETLDYYEGEQNGLRRLAGRPIHRRIVLSVRGEYWLVLDGLLGRGRHDLEIALHFAPDLDVVGEARGLWATGPDGTGAVVATWASSGLAIETARGQEDPICGWCSPGYGRKMPTTTARLISSNASLPAWIAWLIVPYRTDRPVASLSAAMAPEPNGRQEATGPLHLLIERDGSTDAFVYCPGNDTVTASPAPGLSLPVGAAWARLDTATGRAVASWSRP